MTGSAGPSVGEPAASRDATRSLEIFISYRREDSAANAGRLADALVNRFGRDSVFMDVDTIEPGADYTEVIDRAVGHCDVLIALIGPHWLDSANARGRRLDDPKDLVRLEIQSALARNIRVIPALVGGARMPDAEELPGELATLSKRNAVELSHARFQSDLQLLLKPLEKIAEQKGISGPVGTAAVAAPNPPAQPRPAPPPKPGPSAPLIRPGKTLLVAAAAALTLLIALGGWAVLARSGAHNPLQSNAGTATWPASYAGTWRGTGHQFNPSADFAVTMSFQAGKVGQVVGDMEMPSQGCKFQLMLDKVTGQSVTLTEQNGGNCPLAGASVASDGNKMVVSLSGNSLAWKQYQGVDPASANATAQATLSQRTSGTISGSSSQVSVPGGFIGTWTGSGHQFDPSADFALIINLRSGELGQEVGDAEIPSVGCKFTLFMDKATSQSLTLTEQNGGNCPMAGATVVSDSNKMLLTLSGTSLGWKQFQGSDPTSGQPSAEASMAQGTSGPIPGTPNLLSVPDGFIGAWKGTGHQFNPSGDFGLVINIRSGELGQEVGDMEMPSVGCKFSLFLDKATSQSLTLTEQKGGNCPVAGATVVSDGNKMLLTLTGTSLDWKQFQGSDPTSGAATAGASLTAG